MGNSLNKKDQTLACHHGWHAEDFFLIWVENDAILAIVLNFDLKKISSKCSYFHRGSFSIFILRWADFFLANIKHFYWLSQTCLYTRFIWCEGTKCVRWEIFGHNFLSKQDQFWATTQFTELLVFDLNLQTNWPVGTLFYCFSFAILSIKLGHQKYL